MIAILHYAVREGLAEGREFKQKPEVGKRRGRLAFSKRSFWAEVGASTKHRVGNMLKRQKESGWMGVREDQR